MKYKIGFTCGSFDLCHAGHVLMFEEVKNQCEHLIVGLQNDPTVDRPDKNKPVQSIVERQIQLNAIKYIDEVVVYNTEADLLDLLKTLPISVRFVGKDHEDKEFTGRRLNLHPIVYNSRTHNFSTSELRDRVVANVVKGSQVSYSTLIAGGPTAASFTTGPLNLTNPMAGFNGTTASDLGYTKK